MPPALAAALLAFSIGLASPAIAAGGLLDPTFGDAGQVTNESFFIFEGGNPIAFQTDGKIVIAGYQLQGPDHRERFAVARYDTDGSLDPTFGGDGTVSTRFRAGEGCYDSAKSVAIQTDGKIVAVGVSSCPRPLPVGGVTRDSMFAMARYDTAGNLDPTFGGDGTVMTSIGDPARCNAQGAAAALDPDGRIVAAGTSSCSSAWDDLRFAVVRLEDDGSLDASFSGDGIVETNFTPQYDKLTDVVVQPDGKIVVGGTSAYFVVELPDPLPERAALARYETDGTLDPAFGGGDGKVTTSFRSARCGGSNESYSLALQTDGKLLEGGSAGCAAKVGDAPHPRWAMARYRSDGTLDPTFGGDGRVVSIFKGSSAADWMRAGAAIQANGRIVAAGSSGNAAPHFTLARYRPDGRLDTRFGDDGLVQTIFSCSHPGGGKGAWDGLAIQSDGKIVTAGGGGCLSSFVMARFLPS